MTNEERADNQPAPPTLSGRHRKLLRGLAHPMRPVVHVGQGGVTEAIVRTVDRALFDHELIKVRLLDPEDKHAMAELLAEGAHAALCGLVGHTVILYRPHPEKPKIRLD